MEFTNCGQCPLERLHVASQSPEFFSFGVGASDGKSCKEGACPGATALPLPVADIRRVSEVPIPGGCLRPGSSVSLPVWMQGSERSGPRQHQVLFYYEPVEKSSRLR